MSKVMCPASLPVFIGLTSLPWCISTILRHRWITCFFEFTRSLARCLLLVINVCCCDQVTWPLTTPPPLLTWVIPRVMIASITLSYDLHYDCHVIYYCRSEYITYKWYWALHTFLDLLRPLSRLKFQMHCCDFCIWIEWADICMDYVCVPFVSCLYVES